MTRSMIVLCICAVASAGTLALATPSLANDVVGTPDTKPETVQSAASLVELPANQAIALVTVGALSSKTHGNGDLVQLKVAVDVRVGGQVLIIAGTAVTGQIVNAHGTGGLGTPGKIGLRPLFLRLGSKTIRLHGDASGKGSVQAAAIIGLTLFPAISGRDALIPDATPLTGIVERAVMLPVVG
jgi:hypothetical protein